MERRQTPQLYRRESVSVLYVEEANVIFIHKRECLASLHRGGRLLLDTEERERERERTREGALISICRGGRLLL
jgi:hypothetical protein